MPIRNFILKATSTFCFIGYLPFVPGTFGSLAALGLFILLKGDTISHLFFTLLLIILGFLVSAPTARLFNKKDPACIVIDEVCGMLLSLMFIPYDIRLVFLGFVIFRILDSLKPYPINRLENEQGSLGIMGDDIIAGLYTNIILQVVLRVASSKIS
jgi:phosphatidylglycerophosphatase A